MDSLHHVDITQPLQFCKLSIQRDPMYKIKSMISSVQHHSVIAISVFLWGNTWFVPFETIAAKVSDPITNNAPKINKNVVKRDGTDFGLGNI